MGTFRQKVQATTSWVKSGPEDLVETPKTSIFSRIRAASTQAPAKRQRKTRHQPVTAHRLFPAFAALWCAALFGLGGLAISGDMLGAIVDKVGLPALVPAAAPPLGFTAHVLVAFALTIVGGALGLVLGLRLRARHLGQSAVAVTPAPAAETEAASSTTDVYKVRARDAHPDAPPRRPLVLTEAFADPFAGEPSAEPETPLLRRKRGAAPLDEADMDAAPWIPEYTPGGRDAVQPLDLAALDLAPLDLAPFDLGDQSEEPPVEDGGSEGQPESQMAEIAAPAGPAADEADTATVPFPAPPVLIAATPQMPVGHATPYAYAQGSAWSPVAGTPIENLGLVQLIERLALAMAARKSADDAGSGSVGARAEQPEEPVLAAEEPIFPPGPFSMPERLADEALVSEPGASPLQGSAREAILRRLGALPAGELPAPSRNPGSDSAPPFSRPEPSQTAYGASADAIVPLRAEQTADHAASSHAPSADGAAVPFATDEALRTALATLQRMTARA